MTEVYKAIQQMRLVAVFQEHIVRTWHDKKKVQSRRDQKNRNKRKAKQNGKIKRERTKDERINELSNAQWEKN